MAPNGSIHRIGVVRLALTGAIVAGLFYALCWVGRLVLPVGPASHMYLQLFTSADLSSGVALVQGQSRRRRVDQIPDEMMGLLLLVSRDSSQMPQDDRNRK